MRVKFKFFPQVYTSEGINPRRLFFIRQKIKRGKGGYFIIVPASRDDELLEIIGSGELKKSIYNGKRLIVGGISDDKEDAFKLVALMAEDCRRIRGDLNLKEFIACGQFF